MEYCIIKSQTNSARDLKTSIQTLRAISNMEGAQRQRKEINLAWVKENRAEGLVGNETASAPMKG